MPDIDILHHVGVVTRDLNAAVATYERLGFSFTPLSVPRIPLVPGGPPEPLGAANRCAIFQNNYLELLGILDPARWASITPAQRGPFDLDPALARYEGLHVLHLGTDDIEAVRARLVRTGLDPSHIRPFQRPVETPEGPRTMHAKALSLPPGRNPEALLQIAQHETPELVLQPRYMAHANGATSVTGVVICVADPEATAAKYAAYAGAAVVRRDEDYAVELGRSTIVVTTPERLGGIFPGQVAPVVPFLAGFVVAADLARTAAVLDERAVPFRRAGDGLLVGAADACGAAVLFEGPRT